MKKKVLLGVLLAAHSAITVRAMLESSYLDLFKFAFEGWPARQIFSDLTVSLLLVTSWMLGDARKTGRNAWPYVLATVAVGSFAPLAYLLLAPRSQAGLERRA
jgi:Terpene cyclase DEP1